MAEKSVLVTRKYRKMNKFNGVAGLIVEKTNRKTGFVVQLFNGAQTAPVMSQDGKVMVAKCKAHGTRLYAKTYKQAASASVKPMEWCARCKAKVSETKPMVAKKVMAKPTPKAKVVVKAPETPVTAVAAVEQKVEVKA
jgi:hypothetical protein